MLSKGPLCEYFQLVFKILKEAHTNLSSYTAYNYSDVCNAIVLGLVYCCATVFTHVVQVVLWHHAVGDYDSW